MQADTIEAVKAYNEWTDLQKKQQLEAEMQEQRQETTFDSLEYKQPILE